MNLSWYVSRAAGLVSWGLLALSILWGVVMASKVLGRRPGPKWLLDVHRYLGGLAVVFVAVHVVALLADRYVPFTPTQLLVPFTSTYRPLAVAFGIVAMYLLVAVEVTSLLRARIPKRWWRGIHLSSYGLYLLGTVHLLAAGTDAGNPVLQLTVLGVTALLAAGSTFHIVRRREQAAARTTPGAPASPGRPPARVPVAPVPGGGPAPVPAGSTVGAAWVLPDRPPLQGSPR